MLTLSGDTARLWEIEQEQPLRTFQHERGVDGALFASDETCVLMWSDDNTARLWDISRFDRNPAAVLREVEFRTGATVDDQNGAYRVLSFDEWNTRRPGID